MPSKHLQLIRWFAFHGFMYVPTEFLKTHYKHFGISDQDPIVCDRQVTDTVAEDRR